MATRLTGIFGILLVLHAAPAVAGQNEAALALSTTEPWSADFAEDSCAVSRLFEDGDEKVLIEFRSYAPGSIVNARIASNTLSVRAGTPSTQFLPNGEVQAHEMVRTFEAESGWRGAVFEQELPQAEEANGDYLIQKVFKQDIELKMGSLVEVMKVMRNCEDDLSLALGIDPEPNRKLSRPIKLDYNARWLSSTSPMQRDFVKAGSYFQQVRLLVDEQGKVFGCKVIEGATDLSIAARMCVALVEDAKFDPALDANSQPVKSFFILTLAGR